MSGELTPMPVNDILAAVGFKTATGDYPPMFDYDLALLTLVNLTEKLRERVIAHHDVGVYDAIHVGDLCPICTPKPEHHVTIGPPDEDGLVRVHCPCGWDGGTNDLALAQEAADFHIANAGEDPRGA